LIKSFPISDLFNILVRNSPPKKLEIVKERGEAAQIFEAGRRRRRRRNVFELI